MLVGTYLAYVIAMVVIQPQIIYPFGPDRFDNPAFEQVVVSERDVAIAIAQGDDQTAVLYFMGNGGALAYFTNPLAVHQTAGRTIAAMEYPGGGGIAGQPSELRLKTDALAAYDWLATQHDGPIVVHGFSLGTGLAMHVAAHRDVAAVLLDAPFVALCELMTRAAYLPACYMPVVQKWNASVDVAGVTAPVLIQHGTADQLIPITQGERLALMMQGAGLEVTFHAVAGATHNNIAGQAGYGDRIAAFLAQR